MIVVVPLVDFSVRYRQAISEACHVMGRPVPWDLLVLSFENALLLPAHSVASLFYFTAVLLGSGHSLGD